MQSETNFSHYDHLIDRSRQYDDFGISPLIGRDPNPLTASIQAAMLLHNHIHIHIFVRRYTTHQFRVHFTQGKLYGGYYDDTRWIDSHHQLYYCMENLPKIAGAWGMISEENSQSFLEKECAFIYEELSGTQNRVKVPLYWTEQENEDNKSCLVRKNWRAFCERVAFIIGKEPVYGSPFSLEEIRPEKIGEERYKRYVEHVFHDYGINASGPTLKQRLFGVHKDAIILKPWKTEDRPYERLFKAVKNLSYKMGFRERYPYLRDEK